MVEPLKNYSTSFAKGRAWTARAEDHARKRWTIKRERKNQGREGRPNLKKDEGVANKVEKEKPSEKISKARFARFWTFFPRFFLFHFIGHLSLPFFRFDHPSLPWFFLSLLIHHFFLVTSSALAVQALPQAHDMK